MALSLLLQHELAALGGRHRDLLKRYTARQEVLLTAVEVVRSGMHPRMVNPTM